MKVSFVTEVVFSLIFLIPVWLNVIFYPDGFQRAFKELGDEESKKMKEK